MGSEQNAQGGSVPLERRVVRDFAAMQGAEDEALPWKCFHCGLVCRTTDEAREHFGTLQMASPACTIDVAAFREMEELASRYSAEDSDLHREIHRLGVRHAEALRREEEAGYARGLADGMAYNDAFKRGGAEEPTSRGTEG